MVAKWKSVTQHIHNVHEGFDTPEFRECTHDEVEPKDWINPGKIDQKLLN